MSVVNQFKLVNNSNSKGIKFLTATAVSDNITINNIKFATPGAAASSNYSANWGGFQRLISVTATLHSDGVTDKSTDASSKITLIQQKQHLMNSGGVIQGTGGSDAQSDVRWTVTLYMSGTTETITGTIEDFTINGDTGSATTLTCTFNLFEAQ